MDQLFFVNKRKYNIPEDLVTSFLNDNPNAKRAKTYYVGEKHYEIPETEAQSFLESFPNAQEEVLAGQPVLAEEPTEPLQPRTITTELVKGFDSPSPEYTKKEEINTGTREYDKWRDDILTEKPDIELRKKIRDLEKDDEKPNIIMNLINAELQKYETVEPSTTRVEPPKEIGIKEEPKRKVYEPEPYPRTLERKEKLVSLEKEIKQTEANYKIVEQITNEVNRLSEELKKAEEPLKKFEPFIYGNEFTGADSQYKEYVEELAKYQDKLDSYNNFISENQDKLNLVNQEAIDKYSKDIGEYNKLVEEESKQPRYREPSIGRAEYYPELFEKAITPEEIPEEVGLKESKALEEKPEEITLERPKVLDEIVTIPTEQLSTYVETKLTEVEEITPAEVGKAQKDLMLKEYEEELRKRPKEELASPVMALMDNIVWESPIGIAAGLMGVPERTNIERKVMNEKYPIESQIGSGLGTLYSFFSTIGVLQGTGLPLKLTETAIRGSNYPKLVRMLSTGVQGGATFGTYSAIRNAIPYVEENKKIDLDYFKSIGTSMLLGTGLAWTALLKPVPHILGSFAVGTGYGKLAGQDNIDALTTGGMFSLFATFNLKNARRYDKAVAYSQSVHALTKKLSTSKVVADNFSPAATKKVAQGILNDAIAKHGGYDKFKSSNFDNFTKYITRKIQFINDEALAGGGRADVTSITKYFKTTKIPTEAVETLNKFKTPIEPEKKIGVIAPGEVIPKPTIPVEVEPDATFIGMQERVKGKPVAFFNVTEKGHKIAPQLQLGTTVTEQTLKDSGLEVPEYAKEKPIAEEKPEVEVPTTKGAFARRVAEAEEAKLQKDISDLETSLMKRGYSTIKLQTQAKGLSDKDYLSFLGKERRELLHPEWKVKPEVKVEVPIEEKQPWEMTKEEFRKSHYDKIEKTVPSTLPFDWGREHRISKAADKIRVASVRKAIKEGKPVSAEVLAEYPELAKPEPKVEVPVVPEKPAEIPKELEPFAEEARKYKSVEEFSKEVLVPSQVTDAGKKYAKFDQILIVKNIESLKPTQPIDEFIEPDIKEFVKDMEKGELFPPIHIDSENNIIEGHRRFEALRRMGKEKIPVLQLTKEGTGKIENLQDFYNQAVEEKPVPEAIPEKVEIPEKPDYAQTLFNKVNQYIESIEEIDEHNMLSMMLSNIRTGNMIRLQEQGGIINKYFQDSPDVFEIVKDYKPRKLIDFLNRIVKIKGKQFKPPPSEKKVLEKPSKRELMKPEVEIEPVNDTWKLTPSKAQDRLGEVNMDLYQRALREAVELDLPANKEGLKRYADRKLDWAVKALEVTKPKKKLVKPEKRVLRKPSARKVTAKTRIPSKALEGEGFVALKSILNAKVAKESVSGEIVKDYDQIEGVTVGGKPILDMESKRTDYDTVVPERYKNLTGKELSFDEILEEAKDEIRKFEIGEISKIGEILAEKPTPKELFEAEEMVVKEKKSTEEIITEVGGLNPVISESGKTVEFEIPDIGIKTRMKVEGLNYDGVAERIDKRLIKHGIPEEKLELISKKKKLRQKIHAFVSIKGMPKTELQRIVRKQTGHLHTTHKAITVEQLEKILDSVKRTRPKTIKHIRVITKKTENQIKSLKEELVNVGQITEKSYNQILEYLHLGEPTYVSRDRFMSQSNAKLLQKTMLDFAELTEIVNKREKAVELDPVIKEEIDKIHKGYAKKRELIETKKERKLAKIKGEIKKADYTDLLDKAQVGKLSTALNIYHFSNLLEEKSGKPFGMVYSHLAEQKQEAMYEYESNWNKLVEIGGGSKQFAKIQGDKKATTRIEEYIASFMSEYIEGKPSKPTDITDTEKAIAEFIIDDANNFKNFVRQERFFQWLENPERYKIPNAPEKDLKEATDILESKGNKAARNYLDTKTWGVIKTGYDFGEVFTPRVRGYGLKPTISKRGLIARKTIFYQRYERDIISRYRTYRRAMTNREYLNNPIKAMTLLVNTNTELFDTESANRVANMFERNFRELIGVRPPKSLPVEILFRITNQISLVMFSAAPYKGIRNLHQNLAFHTGQDLTKLKKLDPEELEFFQKRINQNKGIQEYFLLDQFPPFKAKILKPLQYLNNIARQINMMGRTDIINRKIDTKMILGRIDNAEKKYPDWATNKEQRSKFLKKIGFGDITAKNRERCLEKLATDGKKAFAREFTFYLVLKDHFPYQRWQRAPMAQGAELELVLSNLLTFRRSYIERNVLDIKKLGRVEAKMGESYKTRRRAGRAVIQIIIMSAIVNHLLKLLTDKDEEPYSPLKIGIGAFGLGGLHTATMELMNNFSWHLSNALDGDDRALATILQDINTSGKYLLPLYREAFYATESLLGYENLDRAIFRQIASEFDKAYQAKGLEYYKTERTLDHAIKHGLFGGKIKKTSEKSSEEGYKPEIYKPETYKPEKF